jgi:hypothetical protein
MVWHVRKSKTKRDGKGELFCCSHLQIPNGIEWEHHDEKVRDHVERDQSGVHCDLVAAVGRSHCEDPVRLDGPANQKHVQDEGDTPTDDNSDKDLGCDLQYAHGENAKVKHQDTPFHGSECRDVEDLRNEQSLLRYEG